MGASPGTGTAPRVARGSACRGRFVSVAAGTGIDWTAGAGRSDGARWETVAVGWLRPVCGFVSLVMCAVGRSLDGIEVAGTKH